MGALLIFLCVGALIGSWLLSGTVPTLIYYGLELLNPTIFYPAACVICAIAALATGSSWTVAGTLGVALIAVSIGLNLSPVLLLVQSFQVPISVIKCHLFPIQQI